MDAFFGSGREKEDKTMVRSGSLRFIVTALATIYLITTVAGWAQQIPTGSVVGTVKDPDGAIVPHAAITITSVRTGIFRSTTSNGLGQFLVADLLPDTYRVEAVLQGFKKFEQLVTVQEAKSTTVDITLQIGSVTETVQVTTEAPLLQTTTASLSTVIDSREVSDLPLLGRNTYMLAFNSGGLVNTLGSSGATETGYGQTDLGVGGTVNAGYIQGSGGWYEENEFTVDGIPNNITDRPAYLPPPDQVQEMSVMTDALDAQYGHSASLTVAVVTKAGTNKFHGDVYEFLQNSVLNANGFFSNLAGVRKPSSRFNQFGGAIGGPIKKNKTFFFFNYEGSRTSIPSTAISTVPTAAQRGGDFSSTFDQKDRLIQIYNPFTTAPDPNNPGQYIRTQFPGNVIPSTLINSASSATAGLLSLIPLPNAAGAQYTGAKNYVVVTDASDPFNDYSARVDHQLTQNNRFFVRFSRERTDYLSTPTYPKLPSAPLLTDQLSVGAGYTAVLSPSTVLDVTLGWAAYHHDSLAPHTDLTNLGFSSLFASQMPESYIPTVSIAGALGFGYQATRYNHTGTWGFNTNMSHIRGRENMKLGFQTQIKIDNGGGYGTKDSFNFNQGFTQGPNPASVGSNVGSGLASYLVGTMLNSSISSWPINQTSTAPYYGVYFQDNVRATPKLTVNVGLRWEIWQDGTDRWNRETAGWAFNTPNPIQAQAQANFAAIEPASILSLLSPSQFGGGVLGGFLFTNPANRRWGETYWNNWDPRIGIAYRVMPRTVLRAGYGMFRGMFWTPFANQAGFSNNTSAAGSLDGITPDNLFSDPFPQGLVPPSGSNLGLMTNLGQAVSFYDQYAQPTNSVRYNVGVQRQITPNTMFEAYYVGNTAYHMTLGSAGQSFSSGLDEEQDFALAYLPAKYLSLGSSLFNSVPNPFVGLISSGSESAATIQEGQLLSTYPEFAAIDDQRKTQGRTYYSSLQATVTKRYSHGLSLLGAYTWSKQIDRYRYLNPSDLGPAKMIGYFDAPQRFTLSAEYELPFGPGRNWGWKTGAGGKLIGGWQVGLIQTFQSGMPVPMDSPVVLTGANPTLSPSQRNIYDWFNTAALAPLPAFTLRSAPWTLATLRADTMNNWDMSFIKNTSIRENLKLQFRLEVSNAFNRCMFSAPDVTPTDTTFGMINAAANTPRQMQAALKLIF
jgi:hypothetical protein